MLAPALTRVATERTTLQMHEEASMDCDYVTMIAKRMARIFGVVGGIVTAGLGMWAVHTASAYRTLLDDKIAARGSYMGMWLIFNGAACAFLEGSIKSNHAIRAFIHIFFGVPLLVFFHRLPAAWVGCGFIIICGILNLALAKQDRATGTNEHDAEAMCGCGRCGCWRQTVTQV